MSDQIKDKSEQLKKGLPAQHLIITAWIQDGKLVRDIKTSGFSTVELIGIADILKDDIKDKIKAGKL